MAARSRARRRSREVVLLRISPALVLAIVLAAMATYLFASSGSGKGSTVETRSYVPLDTSAKIGAGILPIRVLVEPGDGDRALVRLIDHTQRTLFLECYILSDRQVIRALERASAQEVQVFVLLEPHPLGMGPQPQRVADELASAGVAVRWTSPTFALTHAKFLVSDDRVALIASANFSHAGLHGNRDLLVLDGVARDVRSASAVFRADWDGQVPNVADSNMIVAPDNARPRLSSLLSSARRSVSLYAEELGDPGMESLLVRLHRRGVVVRIILAAGQTLPAAQRLEQRGVPVRLLKAPYVHAKMALMDGREAYIGSENMSAQSLDRNRELGVLIRGSALARLSATFKSDWSRAAPVR